MPKLLFRADRHDGYYENDCDFVLVEMTREKAQELLNKAKAAGRIAKKDTSFYIVSYWDYSPQPFGYHDFMDERVADGKSFAERLDECDILVLPDEFEMPKDIEYGAVDTSLVNIDGAGNVSWDFYLRHVDMKVGCGWASKTLLKKIARGESCSDIAETLLEL